MLDDDDFTYDKQIIYHLEYTTYLSRNTVAFGFNTCSVLFLASCKIGGEILSFPFSPYKFF